MGKIRIDILRLSNGFSRKKKNLRAALALYFAY
jgi:hypothetical protein